MQTQMYCTLYMYMYTHTHTLNNSYMASIGMYERCNALAELIHAT